MPGRLIRSATLITVFSLGFFAPQSSSYGLDERHITIGTGGVTGVYYPVGGAICRLINENTQRHGVTCSVETTEGSVSNINAIRTGEIDLGVVQSDWQYHAYYGTSKFVEAGPFKELRAVFSLYPEAVTVVARQDTEIRQLDDLRDHRINIGNPGSGTRYTWDVLEQALGWNRSDLAEATEVPTKNLTKSICGNKIDAYFWLVGHPSAIAKETFVTCDSVLVDVKGPAVDRLVSENPYYRYAIITGGMYEGAPDDVMTFGVVATVVASAKTPPDIIYEVTKAVFEGIETFKSFHPALNGLEKEKMIEDGRSAPLHEGASTYFEQEHLM